MAAMAGRVTTARATSAYLRFDIPLTLRNRRFLVLAVAFPVVFYLLFTRVLTGDTGVDPAAQAFGMVSMAAFGAMGACLSAAVRIAMERTNGWTRQLHVTPLPPSAYVTTKLASAYFTALPSIILVMVVAFVVNGVSLPATTWLAVFIGLAIGAIPFAALGVLIGYVFDESTAQLVFTITYVALAVVGGLWTPITAFPDALATLARLTPSYHFANLGWSEVTGRTLDVADVVVLALYGLAFVAIITWRYRASEQHARG
jgi:ABC-2 type transport system permease protein